MTSSPTFTRALAVATVFFSSATALPLANSLVPALNRDFPDPAALKVGDTFFAYSTNRNNHNVQVATSNDFVNWNLTDEDALPKTGAWSNNKAIWAPDVIQIADESFVMYYSASHAQKQNLHCVGAAKSSTPDGPFTALDDPLFCPLSQGGAIDSSAFIDTDGSIHVVYKVDGNSIGSRAGPCGNGSPPFVPTPLMRQKMKADGVTPDGEAVEMIDRTDADGPYVEAPSLTRSPEGVYFLFYSSNCFTTPLYDVSYATAASIAGPFTRSGKLLVTGDLGFAAPGGAEALADGKMIWHANVKEGDKTIRAMYTGNVTYKDTKATLEVNKPSQTTIPSSTSSNPTSSASSATPSVASFGDRYSIDDFSDGESMDDY